MANTQALSSDPALRNLNGMLPDLEALYRDVHSHPELSMQETGTAKLAADRLRAAGYPIVLAKPFDRRTPSHQCGTVRIGLDPATSPLDSFCRAWDHPNLFVVDASVLPVIA